MNDKPCKHCKFYEASEKCCDIGVNTVWKTCVKFEKRRDSVVVEKRKASDKRN